MPSLLEEQFANVKHVRCSTR